jgi:protein phosphatase
MKLIIEAISDKGNVRKINEDMLLIGNDRLRDATKVYEFDFSTYEFPFLIAVADGLGGHNNGAYASDFVLKKMQNIIRQLPISLPRKTLKSYLTATSKTIHQCMLEEGAADSNKRGMASTFSGLLFYGSKVFYIHVGDSRIYQFTKGNLKRLSKDHSLKELNGNNDTYKNAIVNAFGASTDLFIDFDEISNKVFDDDILMICSDGLSSELSDEEIKQYINAPEGFQTLVNEAKKAGGYDNISLAMIRYVKY